MRLNIKGMLKIITMGGRVFLRLVAELSQEGTQNMTSHQSVLAYLSVHPDDKTTQSFAACFHLCLYVMVLAFIRSFRLTEASCNIKMFMQPLSVL